MPTPISFEDKIEVVNRIIESKRCKWQLRIINWMDFDDVASILRIHIYNKWNKWDQNKPLEPWLNIVASNQIRNLIRNHYSNFTKPCLNCEFSMGGTECKKYQTQNCSCPDFAQWFKTRKRAYDAKLPVTIENHTQEVSNMPSDDLDLEKVVPIFHKKIMGALVGTERTLYRKLFIEHKSEQRVAREMGYKTTEKGRMAGYKRIRQLVKNMVRTSRELIASQGLNG